MILFHKNNPPQKCVQDWSYFDLGRLQNRELGHLKKENMEPNVSENRVIINNVSTNQKNADKIINSKTIGVCALN